jgi:hypothetical protein
MLAFSLVQSKLDLIDRVDPLNNTATVTSTPIATVKRAVTLRNVLIGAAAALGIAGGYALLKRRPA